MSPKIVLIGGRGFIGRALTKQLQRACPTAQLTSPSSHDCDISNEQQIQSACANADVIVNLVGILEETSGRTFDLMHNQGAGNVARVAASIKSRLIHVSALGADANSQTIPYARSKGMGELAVRTAMPTNALILRPSLVIGREDAFLNRFSMLTKYLPVFPIFGSGMSRFQPVFVDNLAQVIANGCLMSDSQLKPTLTLEVGGPKIYTFKEIIQRTTRNFREPSSWLPPYLIHIPVQLALLQAWLMEIVVPKGSPLRITRAQVKQLQFDNIVNNGSGKFVECVDGDDTDGCVVQELVKGVDWKSIDEIFESGKWN